MAYTIKAWGKKVKQSLQLKQSDMKYISVDYITPIYNHAYLATLYHGIAQSTYVQSWERHRV